MAFRKRTFRKRRVLRKRSFKRKFSRSRSRKRSTSRPRQMKKKFIKKVVNNMAEKKTYVVQDLFLNEELWDRGNGNINPLTNP